MEPEDILDDILDFDPTEETVIDKFGKQLPRCHRIKNDGMRCKSFVHRGTEYCRVHGGLALVARAEAGHIATPTGNIPFKKYFAEKVDEYLAQLKTGSFRYSIDREIAALKAMDDYTDEVIKTLDSPNAKDIERSVRMKERIAKLISVMIDNESKRAFQVTANTMKIIFTEMITAVKAEVKSPREQARLLRTFRDIFAPDRMILEPPIDNVEEQRVEAEYYLTETAGNGD